MDGALERLAAEGYPPDLIIDDYPDLLIPARNRKEKRFELSANFEGLRRLANKWGVPAWAASQVGRKAYTKEVITEADVAEDIGKINISDVVLAICQTKDEADEDRCRLFLAKVRDGLRNMMYDAKFYPSQQAIITTNQTKRKDGIYA
jgi:replicative DNA helicase